MTEPVTRWQVLVRQVTALEKLSTRLYEDTDALTEGIRLVEDVLRRLSLGVEAWIPLDGDWDLGYAKYESSWRLVVLSKSDELLLEHASRVRRLAALEKLPELFDALTEEVRDTTERIKKALGTIQSLLQAQEENMRRPSNA
jgi:hypothetical protein